MNDLIGKEIEIGDVITFEYKLPKEGIKPLIIDFDQLNEIADDFYHPIFVKQLLIFKKIC